MRGLSCSLVLNLLAVGSYWGFFNPQTEVHASDQPERITLYQELTLPPSLGDTQFGLKYYPVVSQPSGLPKYSSRKVNKRPGPRGNKEPQNLPARGFGERSADLPSAPGSKKIEPDKLLADNQLPFDGRKYDSQDEAGAGGDSHDRFLGGTPVAAKQGDVPFGNARTGIGVNPHNVEGGEGNGGGGQGGDADRFGSGSGDQFGYSMSWIGGGTRKKLTGAIPSYPPGVNVEARISILAVVSPDGSIKSVRPVQKANTALENAAMKELRYWKFEPLRRTAPQLDQSCVVSFLFKLK
ncbi:MAG TPA: hypothetical protein VMM37_02675 [Bacteroidota bacterium]|nr:hypothetical protein [Bacteroidota bacterium]